MKVLTRSTLPSPSGGDWELSHLISSRVTICLAILLLTAAAGLHAPTALADDHAPTLQPQAPPALKRVVLPELQSASLLIHKVEPEYPVLAKAARISGIVMVQATITKNGEITNLRVVCGPTLLQEASLKAISQWRYRPYILLGTAVDVDTTIKVTFSLGKFNPKKFSKDSCPVQ